MMMRFHEVNVFRTLCDFAPDDCRMDEIIETPTARPISHKVLSHPVDAFEDTWVCINILAHILILCII